MNLFSAFALNSFDVTLRSGLDTGRVGFVRVNVHGQGVARIDAHQHVAENQFAIAGNAHAHGGLVAHAVAKCVLGRHVNVAQGANHAAVHLHAAGRTFERATGTVRNVTALTNGRVHAELELFGHRNFDLRVFARRAKDAHAF